MHLYLMRGEILVRKMFLNQRIVDTNYNMILGCSNYCSYERVHLFCCRGSCNSHIQVKSASIHFDVIYLKEDYGLSEDLAAYVLVATLLVLPQWYGYILDQCLLQKSTVGSYYIAT